MPFNTHSNIIGEHREFFFIYGSQLKCVIGGNILWQVINGIYLLQIKIGILFPTRQIGLCLPITSFCSTTKEKVERYK